MINKRGQGIFGNIFLFMAISFVIVIVSVIFTFIGDVTYSTLMAKNETLQANFPGVNVTEVINDTVGKIPTAYDSLKWITVMLIIGMVIAVLVASFSHDSHCKIFLVRFAMLTSLPFFK